MIPTISKSQQTIDENGQTGALPFTVGDPDTPLDSLVVTASSSTALISGNDRLVLGGTGASRTITCIPFPNQSGTATIT
jgi:hypothetical protein